MIVAKKKKKLNGKRTDLYTRLIKATGPDDNNDMMRR